MKIKIAVVGILMLLCGITGCFLNTQAKSGNEQDPAVKIEGITCVDDLNIYLMTDNKTNKQYFILSKSHSHGGICVIERDQNDLQLER